MILSTKNCTLVKKKKFRRLIIQIFDTDFKIWVIFRTTFLLLKDAMGYMWSLVGSCVESLMTTYAATCCGVRVTCDQVNSCMVTYCHIFGWYFRSNHHSGYTYFDMSVSFNFIIKLKILV